MESVSTVALLIIDDFGMRKLPQTAAEDLLEIIMRRYERASTLLTSNRPVDDWGKLLADVAAVSAMLDRLQVHRLNAGFHVVVANLQLFDGLPAYTLLGPIRLQHGVRQPLQDRLGNHQFSQNTGKLSVENLLARVRLGALAYSHRRMSLKQ